MRTERHKDEEAAVPASHVALVAFDGVEALDVAGPASVFSKAELLRPGTYRLHIASPRGGAVTTNSGLDLARTCALRELPQPIDTLVFAGGEEPAVRSAIVEHGVAVRNRGVVGELGLAHELERFCKRRFGNGEVARKHRGIPCVFNRARCVALLCLGELDRELE